jgi:transcriptional regulator with XRE-family HTH domain
MGFSHTFAEVLNRNGLTKNSLAERIGVHRSYLSRVEAGQRDLGNDDLGKVLVELTTEDAVALVQSFLDDKLAEIVEAHDRHRGKQSKLRVTLNLEGTRGRQ